MHCTTWGGICALLIMIMFWAWEYLLRSKLNLEITMLTTYWPFIMPTSQIFEASEQHACRHSKEILPMVYWHWRILYMIWNWSGSSTKNNDFIKMLFDEIQHYHFPERDGCCGSMVSWMLQEYRIRWMVRRAFCRLLVMSGFVAWPDSGDWRHYCIDKLV